MSGFKSFFGLLGLWGSSPEIPSEIPDRSPTTVSTRYATQSKGGIKIIAKVSINERKLIGKVKL